MSEKALFAPPKAIRGGIPVCWPQFSAEGPLGQHGFARNSRWTLAAGGAEPDGAFCELQLSDDEATRAAGWPHAFALSLRVSLRQSGALHMRLVARNTGESAFSFTTALHTYFRTPDSSRATVSGLAGTSYLDSLQGRARVEESSSAVGFACEVDRIYLDVLGAPGREVSLVDTVARRTLAVSTVGLPDAVVWNPWIAKAAAMADFGDEEYKTMVCIEAAAIGKRVHLEPGASWTGEQTLTHRDSAGH